MSTRVGLLNSTASLWNDRDLYAIFKDFVGANGGGVVNVDRAVTHLTNGLFSNGSGSISADGWIGSDANNGWFADIGGTATVDFDLVNFLSSPQSLRIVQTVNSGTDITRVRLTQNPAGSFTTTDLLNLIPVKPGKTYRASVNIRTSGVSSGFGGGAQIAMSGYDSTGTLVGVELFSTPITGSAGFQAVTLDFAAASNVVYLAVEMRIKNETGTVNFDGISMVELGTDCQVIAQTIPNNTVAVKTGVAYFNITDPSANQFLVRYEVTAQQNVSVTNNVSGLDRIDLVVLKYDNTVTPNVTASNIGLIQVIAGTPAGSPVAPAVPANSIAIAQIYMANGATVVTSGQITDRRTQMKWQNMDFLNSMGTQPEQKRPATVAHLGQVVLSDAPTDPNIPVAVGENYGGLLTPAEKASLLAGVPSIGTTFTFGSDTKQGMNVSIESDGNVYMTRPKTLQQDAIGSLLRNQPVIDDAPLYSFLANKDFAYTSWYETSAGNAIWIGKSTLDVATKSITAVATANIGVTLDSSTVRRYQMVKIDSDTAVIVAVSSGTITGYVVKNLGNAGAISIGAAQALGTCTNATGIAVANVNPVAGVPKLVLVKFVTATGIVSVDLSVNIASSTITTGTVSTMFATADSLFIREAHQSGTANKIAVFYKNTTTGLGTVLVGDYNSTTGLFTTVGTPVTVTNTAFEMNAQPVGTSSFIYVGVQTSSGNPFVNTLKITGTTPTLGTATNLVGAILNNLPKMCVLSDYHFVATFDTSAVTANSGRKYIIEVSPISENELSVIGSALDENGKRRFSIVGWLPDTEISYHTETGGSNLGQSRSATSTMLTNHDSYIGINTTDMDVSVTASGTVKVAGVVSPTYAALTTGTVYKTDNSGDYTTLTGGNREIGAAISANTILKD